MLSCDDYITAKTLDEAFDAMAAHAGRYRLIAGATDTYPWAREGRAGDVHVPTLIDVAKIPELKERSVGKRVRLGAATPIQRFMDDPALVRALPCMPRCAIWFADDQIRESATVGGNIINASPAGDAIPPLVAHQAEVELASRQDGKIVRRRMPLTEFITGPGATKLGKDELLVAVECDPLTGYGGSFEKVGHRRSLVISLVCLATLVKIDASGKRFEDVRLAIGGVGPLPRRLRDVEQFLMAVPISAARLEQAAELPVDLVQSRTRQTYRREVVRGFLVRGLLNAAQQAGADLGKELEVAYG